MRAWWARVSRAKRGLCLRAGGEGIKPAPTSGLWLMRSSRTHSTRLCRTHGVLALLVGNFTIKERGPSQLDLWPSNTRTTSHSRLEGLKSGSKSNAESSQSNMFSSRMC